MAPADCAISFDNLRTVPKSMLTGRIASLSGAQMHDACAALNLATGCS